MAECHRTDAFEFTSLFPLITGSLMIHRLRIRESRRVRTMHVEYIENQLNIIRFSPDRAFDIAKFHGALDYFVYKGDITLDEHQFFLDRALVFWNYSEKYPVQQPIGRIGGGRRKEDNDDEDNCAVLCE